MAHQIVDEIWFIVRGHGEMWRKSDNVEKIVPLSAGLSLTIPIGTHFQFRNTGSEPLKAVGVTMPPWPGMDEAYVVARKW